MAATPRNKVYAVEKKKPEPEVNFKIAVVYKTQIWQDHQSVYRNTNTTSKSKKLLNTQHVQTTP